MKTPTDPLYEEAELQPDPSVIPEENLERFEDSLKSARDVEEMVDIFNNEVSALNEQPKAVVKIDDLYKKLVDQMHEKNFKFEDHLFPSNSSSMVNNSRKTKQQYAFNEWKPLHKIYQNIKILKDFIPQNLFPGGSTPTELAVALAALCQQPDRIKRLFCEYQEKDQSRDLYLVKINRSGKWTPILVDDKVPLKKNTTQDEPFVLIPNSHFESTRLKADESENMTKKSLNSIPAMEI